MKLTKKIIENRPGMTVAKADALFGGQVSKWIQGEPVPERYRSRLESLFGNLGDAPEPVASAPIKKEKKTTKPKTKKRRR
jgi:hypothetical protein